ncbi:hypothetical protein QJS04_geneDACA023846 [Acorus gramineus]|uniref:Uncharacterized protein n=1 Tax=Acorus gramineus TaxID=55184 RepID=A0AAV9BM44_ACOGR|nr:hypothetical protein QJS04_geneDACA023846 [Acorus gramineus]
MEQMRQQMEQQILQEVQQQVKWMHKEEAAAVPRGCVTVYGGEGMRKFVISAEYLSTPNF